VCCFDLILYNTCTNRLVVKKNILTCFAQTLLISSHLSSHLLAILAKLKPTPNRTNLVAQSKYIYMTQEAIKIRKQAKQN